MPTELGMVVYPAAIPSLGWWKEDQKLSVTFGYCSSLDESFQTLWYLDMWFTVV